MRTALYNSITTSVVPYLPKTLSYKHLYQYLHASLSYSLKTLPNYKFRRYDNIVNPTQDKEITIKKEKSNEIVLLNNDIPIVIITEEIPLVIPTEEIPLRIISMDIPEEPIDEEEMPLTFIFKKDIPQEIIVSAKVMNTLLPKKKNILPAKLRNLTWKNNTSIPDSIIIEAKKLWEDNCGILFTPVDDNPLFTFEVASDNLENHPDLKDTIAMAFFPHELLNESPKKRTVNIFKKFDSQFNKVAALAHELGHIMGFCHEHEDHVVNRHFTDNLYEEYISEYDPQSIMNYSKLWIDEKHKIVTKLSDLDIKGARQLYGEPINRKKALQMSG